MGELTDEIASLPPAELHALALMTNVLTLYPQSARPSSPNDRQNDLARIFWQCFDLLCEDLRLR